MKIIQATIIDHRDVIVVLCDDGTLWWKDGATTTGDKHPWHQIDTTQFSSPQPDPPASAVFPA